MDNELHALDTENCAMKIMGQCCCTCHFQLTDRSHPSTNGNKISNTRGYICAPSPLEWSFDEDKRPVAHSGWPKHSVGCELYSPRGH